MAKLRLTYDMAPEPNGSDTIIPYNRNGIFDDSWLGYDPSGVLFSIDPTLYYGIHLEFVNRMYCIGTFANNISVNETVGRLDFNGSGITSGTSGGASGANLNVNINGTPYKIALRNL